MSTTAERQAAAIQDELTAIGHPDQSEEGGIVLVRRASDGEVLLGHALDDVDEVNDDNNSGTFNISRIFTQEPGLATVVMHLLNHENLVSIAGVVRHVDVRATGGSGAAVEKRYLVWDRCDAGTLANVFADPPTAKHRTGFLPASLCWHVLVSLLRALAWLHDGYREDERYFAVEVDGDGDGDDDDGGEETEKAYCVEAERSQWQGDPDWMPILHRGISPENIFFQQPRGSESYGLCKLGNYSRVHVSGHILSRSEEGVAIAGEWDVAEGEEELTLEEMVDSWDKATGRGKSDRGLKRSKRPYTQGSDLYAVGAILYRMMTGSVLPDMDECHRCGCLHQDDAADRRLCPHHCELDVGIDIRAAVNKGRELFARFTDYHNAAGEAALGLDCMVGQLLAQHRQACSGGGDGLPAWEAYTIAKAAWEHWMRYDRDGQLIITLEEDLKRRWLADWERTKEKARWEDARWR